MQQSTLNRAIAHVTGEPVDRIRRLGFQLVVVPNRQPPRRSPTHRLSRLLARARRLTPTAPRPVCQAA